MFNIKEFCKFALNDKHYKGRNRIIKAYSLKNNSSSFAIKTYCYNTVEYALQDFYRLPNKMREFAMREVDIQSLTNTLIKSLSIDVET